MHVYQRKHFPEELQEKTFLAVYTYVFIVKSSERYRKSYTYVMRYTGLPLNWY